MNHSVMIKLRSAWQIYKKIMNAKGMIYCENKHSEKVNQPKLKLIIQKVNQTKEYSFNTSNFTVYHLLNPYRQIPETISKKRAVTQGISRKLFPGVFQILQFWGVTQGIFRKLFPGKFHEYLPMKKYFFPKTGHDSEAFPETFSRRISYAPTQEKVLINTF